MWWMAASAALSAYGQWQANQQKAQADQTNAAYYRTQAAYDAEATQRQVMVFNQKATAQFGETVGTAAHNGVALGSGGINDVLGQEQAQMTNEKSAIEREGQFRQQLALMRANESDSEANYLTSSASMFETFGGAALKFGASAYSSKE